MLKNKSLKQTPVLKVENSDMRNGRKSQPLTSQNASNQYYVEDLRLQDEENDWVNSDNRYGGWTQKRKDSEGNWEYCTKFESGIVIDENFTKINNSWKRKKIIWLTNNKVIFELADLDNNNQIQEKFKVYESKEAYLSDLRTLDLNTFNIIEEKKSIKWGFMIAALGIIPLVVFARNIQRVFSVNINDNNYHPIEDWTTNILDITNEKAQYNLMMASADIIFSLLTSEIFKWSCKNIVSCCQNENNTNTIVNSTYPITLAIHFWSTFSNHVVVTAAAMYTLDSFTWVNYGWKLIDKFNILSTIARLYAMTSINDWFKWSLATINNELQLSKKVSFCSNIFNNISKSINESYYFIKFITAVFGFGAITFSSNALKTLASLIAENSFDLSCSKFPNKFFTWGMLGTATAMSLTDGLNLMLDNYKKSIWKPFVNGTKWIWNKATLCCFMNNSESNIEYTHFADDLVENGGIIKPNDGIEREILAYFATIEGQNKDFDALINKFKILNISEINATQPPTNCFQQNLQLIMV